MVDKGQNIKESTLYAQVSHWQNETSVLQKKIASYDRSFGFLCANMEKSQLCTAISKIKKNDSTPLPPAIRSFLARNVSGSTTRDVVNIADAQHHPVLASADSLVLWATRQLEKQQTTNLHIRTNDTVHDASLALAETNFRVRDLAQQLQSSNAIQADLLNKALVAEQKLRAETGRPELFNVKINEASNNVDSSIPSPGSYCSVSSNPSAGRSVTSTGSVRAEEASMHWKIRCEQLEAHCQDLQKSLTEEQNNNRKELESIIQSELKSAKNTIRQLRALVQAKQDKIDILEQMKQIQIPRR